VELMTKRELQKLARELWGFGSVVSVEKTGTAPWKATATAARGNVIVSTIHADRAVAMTKLAWLLCDIRDGTGPGGSR
jgi:hypothetical protein